MKSIIEHLRGKHPLVEDEVKMTMRGMVEILVVDSKTGEVVERRAPQKNLILNQGMDDFASQYLCDLFLYCVAGSGTTPTSVDSGTTTAARAGTTVTLSGGSFLFTNTATDAGKMLKWDSGEEARIVTVTSTTVCEVATSGTIAAGEFISYNTNQTGLTTELKRTQTYLTGAGNCDTTINAGAGTVAFKRTYDFSAEVGSVTYNEIGFSRVATVSNNLFSRILLSSGVALVSSQQLRVVYTLTVSFSPFTSTAVGASPITGWAGATGDKQIQYPNMAYVDTDGTTQKVSGFPHGAKAFEPSQVGSDVTAWLCTNTTACNSFGSNGPDRSSGALQSSASTNGSYTSLSFTRTKSAVFTVSQGNGTTWRTIVFGGILTNANVFTRQAYVYLMGSNQTKDSSHTLTLNLAITWGRTLA